MLQWEVGELAAPKHQADATWRIDRITGIEEALYVKGCKQFAAEVTDLDPRARLTMLRMHTHLAYERQFRNLQIQEMRLHRLREKLRKAVKELQRQRAQKEKDELAQAAKLYIAPKPIANPSIRPTIGSNFQLPMSKYIYTDSARIN
ncbi:MAG: hypothetical protein M3Y57_14435 [Acidobacteriota bacterium]|nr:hypothetical protein [Acidobacteriota bacterium]